MKYSLIISIILLISFQSIFSQNKILTSEMQNYFDELIVNSDPELDCEIFQKLVGNTIKITVGKFSRKLELKMKSKPDLTLLTTEILNYLFEKHSKISMRLSECTPIPKHDNDYFYFPDEILKNGFGIKIYRTILMSNSLFYNNLPIIDQVVQDSLNKIYDNWRPTKIKFSDNSIDFTVGVYETYFNKYKVSEIIRKNDLQYEIKPYENSKLTYRINWTSTFEYTLEFIKKEPDQIFPHEVEKLNCRITEVTDSSYIGLIKSNSGIRKFHLFRKK